MHKIKKPNKNIAKQKCIIYNIHKGEIETQNNTNEREEKTNANIKKTKMNNPNSISDNNSNNANTSSSNNKCIIERRLI